MNERDDQITETKAPESQLPPQPSSLAPDADMQKIYAALRDDKDDMDLGEDDEEMDSDEEDDDEIPEDFMGDDDGEEDSPPQFDINIENPYNGQTNASGNFSQSINTESKNLVDSLNDRVTEGSFQRNRAQEIPVASRPQGQEVEGGAVTSSPKGTPGSRGKKKVKFENKSVRFDENTAIPSSIHRPMSANKAAQIKNQQQSMDASDGSRSAPMSSTQTLLELEKEIKIHQSEGNFSERNKNLLRYCRMANETAQSVDLKDQKKAMTLLQQCVKIIKENATKQTPFDELLYETYNNIARCFNILGDIEASLEFLLKAYEHALNLAREREVGSVTILPELSLNICNAQIYEMNYQEANRFATEAVRTSSQCIIKLTQKLDQPISDDPVIMVEQQRLSELYKSQVKLHIQGYQARGRIYEKMNKFKDAIREYTKAKKVVEQNFGTNNDLFKDAVAQVTAANVNFKTQSYTGRIDGGGKFSNAASMSSSWSTGKKSRKSQKKDPSPDRDVVQITDDVIDIRSMDKSDFDQQSLLQNSIQTEQAAKPQGGELVSNKVNRRLRSARSKKSREVIAKKGSSRPKRKSTTRLLTNVEYAKRGIQPIVKQPPFNVGSSNLGFNYMNHMQSMVRNNDLWKFNHYYTPNMIGYLGYQSHNLERPRSFYHTSIKLNHRPLRRPSTPKLRVRPKYQRTKTVVKIEQPSPQAQESSLAAKATSTATNSSQEMRISQEIEDLKEKLRTRTSSSDLGLNEAVRNLQERQNEQRRSLMEAIESQKQDLLERQRREREQARAEREALMLKIQAQSQQQLIAQQQQNSEKKKRKSAEKKAKKEKVVEVKQEPPQVQVPPVHPIYGPAVYDSVRNQWTYPYAQWYGPGGMQQQEEEVEVVEEQEPEPQREDFSAQKDFEVKLKPVMSTSGIQTDVEEKTVHQDIALQTLPLEQVDFGTSPLKLSPKIEKKKTVVKKSEKYARENQAASVIQKHYKKRIQNRREQSFNTREQGMLFTRKRKYNQLLGAIEIMSMYVVGTMENRCKCLRFTIFNYATKQFSYLGIYDKLSHLEEFDLNVLFELSKPSLEEIDFERSPFRFHILCMQSIINTSRIVRKPLKEVKLVEEKEVKVKKEPEVIVVEPTKPDQTEIGTQMEPPTEDWILEAEENEVEEHEVEDDMDDKDPLVFKTETRLSLQSPEKEPVNDLYRPKARPTIEPKIIKIQRWIRKQLFRQKLRILLMVKQRDSKRLLYSHMRKIETKKFGTKYFTVSLFKKTQTSNEGVPVATGDGGYQLQDENKVSEIYILEAKEQLDPSLQDSLRKQKLESYITIYNDIRLPENQAVLKYYLLSGTILTIDEDTGIVDSLKLVRLKIKLCWAVPIYRNSYQLPDLVPIDVIGCNLKLQFHLKNYPGHLCKVYKRLRYEDAEQREGLIKDWKIKVVQLEGANSSDYIVVRRLPCRISDVENVIQQTLEVRHNKRIVPSTILHLVWNLNNLTIYSQKFYDFNQPRFLYEHVGTYHFQQQIGSNRRVPEDFQIENERWDPLYEVYIQKMVPRVPQVGPYKYAAPAYLKWKEDRRMAKKGLKKPKMVSKDALESDSSASDDDNDARKYVDDECFWDEQEIVRMQLDETHAAQQYYKVTVTKSIDKQDQDFFRIECDVAHWPHPDVEYQYLMENLLLKQKKNPATGEINIKTAGLKIRNMEYRYASDNNWAGFIRSTGGLEFFMSQDSTRWRNQNFSCTVYNTRNHGGGFLIEAINVDKPFQRAYQRVPTLMGMRGKILKYYIDSQLKIVGEKDSADLIGKHNAQNYDQSIGFGDEHVISSIVFASTPEQFRNRMQRDANYCMWQYEKLGDDEKEAGFAEPRQTKYDPEEAAREEAHQNELRALKDKARQQQIKAEKKKQQHGVMTSVLKRMKERRADLEARLGDYFTLWRRVTIEEERKRREKLELEREERLKVLGEEIAKFEMPYKVVDKGSKFNKEVQLLISINKFAVTNFYQITIQNLQNAEKKDDTIVTKIMRLPEPLKNTERDPKKIKHVFTQKLRVAWWPMDRQTDGIPRMLDAFIDNTVVKEQTIHKIVEVKVWDEYHKKKAKKDKKKKRDEDSDYGNDSQLDVDEEELRMIKTDIATLKKILKLISKKIELLDKGIEAWYKTFDKDGSDHIEVNELYLMLDSLNLSSKIEDRLVLMLFRLFDRDDEGYFTYKDFVDILTRRMRPDFLRIVRAERERFRLHGLGIKRPPVKKPEEPVPQPQVVNVRKSYAITNLFDQPPEQQEIHEKEIVYVKKQEIVEKPVIVDREIKVKREVIVPEVQQQVTIPLMQLAPDDGYDEDWGELSYRGDPLNIVQRGVFMVKDAIMSYKIMRDSQGGLYKGNDNWWFSLETKAQNQVFNLYNTVKFGKVYLESAVKEVTSSQNEPVQNKQIDAKLNSLFKKQLESVCEGAVSEKQQPEEWIPKLKDAVKKEFSR